MFKFKGQGQHDVCVITYDALLQLIMILPGIDAALIRSKFVVLLKRIFAGDVSLVEEILSNNQSNGDINQMAREVTGIQQADPNALIEATVTQLLKGGLFDTTISNRITAMDDTFRKRRKLQLYDLKMEEGRRERERKHEVTIKQIEEGTKSTIVKEQAAVAMSQAELGKEQERTKQLQLQIELKKLEQGSENFVTVSRVVQKHFVIRNMSDKVRNAFLSHAGSNVRAELQALGPKVLDAFNKFAENTYDSRFADRIKSIVQKTYESYTTNTDIRTFWPNKI